MATSSTAELMHYIRRITVPPGGRVLTDGQLLRRFVEGRDENAIAAILHRHGPMVWGVCRRVLKSHHDAEDAFQITFTIFVRKAFSINPPEMLANWLYGVAYKTALKTSFLASRRSARERQTVSMPEPP